MENVLLIIAKSMILMEIVKNVKNIFISMKKENANIFQFHIAKKEMKLIVKIMLGLWKMKIQIKQKRNMKKCAKAKIIMEYVNYVSKGMNWMQQQKNVFLIVKYMKILPLIANIVSMDISLLMAKRLVIQF